jgi:predicted ATPase
MLTQFSARAFKGLRSFTIAPQPINLLIGANGTGKTNFADLIAFVAAVCQRGLAAAINDAGGLEHLRTRQPSAGTPYRFRIELRLGEDLSRGIKEAHYGFELAQLKNVIKVRQEALQAIVYKRKPGRPSRAGVPRFDSGQPITLRFHREDTVIKEWSDAVGPIADHFEAPQELILSSYGRLGELRTLTDFLSSWRVYNVDAAMAKRSTGGSDTELDRYGENIAPYLARILRDDHSRERLLGYMREAVPYIQNIKPDRVLTFQSLRFTEADTGADFQLGDMSDGTIRLLGLLSILRQSIPPAVVVIEEPENALHAHAIHNLVGEARRASMSSEFATQVFFTSHSPAVVDAVLSPEALRETSSHPACFVTQRKANAPSIVAAPDTVMKAIADNLGRPSDFYREGSFGDQPVQMGLFSGNGNEP